MSIRIFELEGLGSYGFRAWGVNHGVGVSGFQGFRV